MTVKLAALYKQLTKIVGKIPKVSKGNFVRFL